MKNRYRNYCSQPTTSSVFVSLPYNNRPGPHTLYRLSQGSTSNSYAEEHLTMSSVSFEIPYAEASMLSLTGNKTFGVRTTDRSSSRAGDSTIEDDKVSVSSQFTFSTNYTMSNLAGPGRVLGNLYSFTGRRLEKTLADIAHRAGFGPEAIFQKIRDLYSENWKRDTRKGETPFLICIVYSSSALACIGTFVIASVLHKLSFRLLEHTK